MKLIKREVPGGKETHFDAEGVKHSYSVVNIGLNGRSMSVGVFLEVAAKIKKMLGGLSFKKGFVMTVDTRRSAINGLISLSRKEREVKMRSKILVPCEFCGEPVYQNPDDAPWRIVDRKRILHIFCSYLCALRYFGLGRSQ